METGFLASSGIRWGLGGPMPVTIAPVVTGRCRPSSDRVPEGASPDRDSGAVVPGNLADRAGQGFCQCWAPQRLVRAVSTATIATPCRVAIDTSRAGSLPVGMPEISRLPVVDVSR
ncbi:hypothetical protein [Saccharothrix longispora]|uniref:hypothetical protein n=1 Tax=Saccharothrix longispora TaxID=33920 RepID=UPI0028FD6834|nr:hypothetical protein [Saccharothrix longispora]MDU0288875.1 hypothetical protein [Saccharothrix longispora]